MARQLRCLRSGNGGSHAFKRRKRFTLPDRTGYADGKFVSPFLAAGCPSRELPKPDCPPVRVRILSEDLIVFRDTNGKVGLLSRYCPHRGASLFFGRNEENGLRCVYHGWKFDVNGECVDMPNERGRVQLQTKDPSDGLSNPRSWRCDLAIYRSATDYAGIAAARVDAGSTKSRLRTQAISALQLSPERRRRRRFQLRVVSPSRVPAGKIQRCHCGTGAPCPGEGHRAEVFATGNGVRTGSRCASQLGRGPILLACN